MKLYYSPTSPFARKVILAAHALGLDSEIEKIRVDVYQPGGSYTEINPLKKIPALQTRDGQILLDSSFIAQYLNDLSPVNKIIPSAPERWQVMSDLAVADGILEASVLRLYEKRRPVDRFDTAFDGRQKDKVDQGFQYFEKNIARFLGEPNIASLTLMCALGYVDFRFPNEKWHDLVPRLQTWYQARQNDEAFLKTTPKD
jgi:glutathione S-transferase